MKDGQYKPGTRWCNKCRNEAPKRFKNWPQLEEKIVEVCFIIRYMYPFLMLLYLGNAGENGLIFHIYYVSGQVLFSQQIFVSCHNLRIVAVLYFV